MTKPDPVFIGNEIFIDNSKYRAKFVIHTAKWNPTFELLAIASNNGEIVLKRTYWETAWKINFGKISIFKNFPKTLCDNVSLGSLMDICWSPNGNLLLIAFQSGKLFYLDTQNGKILFQRRVDYEPKTIFWFGDFVESQVKWDAGSNIIISTNDIFFLSKQRNSEKFILSVETFCKEFLPKTLNHTLLCILTKTFVEVLADGLMPIFRFPISGNILDDGIIENIVLIKDPTTRLQLISSTETVLDVPLNLSDKSIFLYSKIATSSCWMFFVTIFIQEVLGYISEDWKTQSEMFHQRIFSKMINQSDKENYSPNQETFSFKRDLWFLLTTGIVPNSFQKFLSNEAFWKDCKEAHAFLDEYFPNFLVGISSCLRPASQLLLKFLKILESSFNGLEELKKYGSENNSQILLDTLYSNYNKEFLSNVEQVFQSSKTVFMLCGFSEAMNSRKANKFFRLKEMISEFEAELIDSEITAQFNYNTLTQLLSWFCSLVERYVETSNEGVERRLIGSKFINPTLLIDFMSQEFDEKPFKNDAKFGIEFLKDWLADLQNPKKDEDSKPNARPNLDQALPKINKLTELASNCLKQILCLSEEGIFNE